MDKRQEILIENELYKLVTTLYDAFDDKAKDDIKEAVKDFAETNNLSEIEVLDKLNSMTKNRSSNYKSVDLSKWYDEKE